MAVVNAITSEQLVGWDFRNEQVIVVGNVRAISAYAKLGFRPVGILRSYQLMAGGEWVDGLLMDLLASELVR